VVALIRYPRSVQKQTIWCQFRSPGAAPLRQVSHFRSVRARLGGVGLVFAVHRCAHPPKKQRAWLAEKAPVILMCILESDVHLSLCLSQIGVTKKNNSALRSPLEPIKCHLELKRLVRFKFSKNFAISEFRRMSKNRYDSSYFARKPFLRQRENVLSTRTAIGSV